MARSLFRVGDFVHVRQYGTRRPAKDPQNLWRIITLQPQGRCTIQNVPEQEQARKRGATIAPREFHTSLLIKAKAVSADPANDFLNRYFFG
jgi:hypothetical protein